jgi:hypothetical protein
MIYVNAYPESMLMVSKPKVELYSRLALGPIRLRRQRILEALSQGVKQPRHEANKSPLPSAEFKVAVMESFSTMQRHNSNLFTGGP